jgi:hypothetical protein
LTLARAAKRKQEAQAELAKERTVRSRQTLASAIKVLELRDVFATGAKPVMRSVVVQTGLMARVEAAWRRQQEDGVLEVNALIHVYAGFGGVPYTIRGVGAGYYTQSTSEFVATTVGPFQMASKADLDLIVRDRDE